MTFSSRPLAVYAARYLQQLEHEVAGKAGVGGGPGEFNGDDQWKAILNAARLCQVAHRHMLISVSIPWCHDAAWNSVQQTVLRVGRPHDSLKSLLAAIDGRCGDDLQTTHADTSAAAFLLSCMT